MKQCIKEDDKDTRTLRFSGDLVIQHAEELKSVLIESIAEKNNILIDISLVAQADISCMQLLCSAHKTSIFQGKSLKFIGTSSEAFSQNVKRAGFSRTKGCIHDNGSQCLWLKENKHG